MRLIGFAGAAGVGKDTAANLIMCHYKHWRSLALAAPIKRMLAAMLNCTVEELDNRDLKEVPHPITGKSPRSMAQTLGTEWGRNVHPELWLALAVAEINKNDQAGLGTIVTDIRFDNEANYIRSRGVLVHLRGRHVDLEQSAASHPSNRPLPVCPEDIVIYNTGTVQELLEELECNLNLG